MESIAWTIDLARVAGIRRIVLDGCFVTEVPEPNDVDFALMAEPGDIVDDDAVLELTDGLPFVDANVFDSEEFEPFLNSFFAFDRRHRGKGMIEVISWNPG